MNVTYGEAWNEITPTVIRTKQNEQRALKPKAGVL